MPIELITFCIKCYVVCNTNIRQTGCFNIEAKSVVLKLSGSYHLKADQMSTCVAPFCIKCDVVYVYKIIVRLCEWKRSNPDIKFVRIYFRLQRY